MDVAPDRSEVKSDQDAATSTRPADAHDVPGMLAGSVGDLYASEERKRRIERTERMISKAHADA